MNRHMLDIFVQLAWSSKLLKLDTFNFSTKPSYYNQTKNIDQAEELDTLFNCDECDYKRISIKWFKLYKKNTLNFKSDLIDGQDYIDIKTRRGRPRW